MYQPHLPRSATKSSYQAPASSEANPTPFHSVAGREVAAIELREHRCIALSSRPTQAAVLPHQGALQLCKMAVRLVQSRNVHNQVSRSGVDVPEGGRRNYLLEVMLQSLLMLDTQFTLKVGDAEPQPVPINSITTARLPGVKRKG